MTDNALLANLIMDKFKAPRGAPKRRRASRKPSKKGKGKRKTRRWKMVKLPSGVQIKVAKKGWLQTPAGRYVRSTIENLQRYYNMADADYEPGATDLNPPPGFGQ